LFCPFVAEEVKLCDQLLGLNEQSIQIYQSQLKVNKDVAKLKIQTLERQLQQNKRNYFNTIAKLNQKNVELSQECERLKKTDYKRKRKEQTFQKGNERKKTKLTDF
jgi:DNA repair photolyase